VKKKLTPAQAINRWTIKHLPEILHLYIDGKRVEYKVRVNKPK
jgi:hypothetical protein